ncbi:MAG: cystathionine gamma-synthase family protein [Methylorubrum populi]
MNAADRVLHPETLTIAHGYDPHAHQGAAKPPIFPTSTYLYRSAQHAKNVHRAYFDGVPLPEGEESGFIYARVGHPNLTMIERRLAVLDKGVDSAVFASGMAAISTVMLAFLRPADTILHSRPLYGGTDSLLYGELSALGIRSFGFRDGLDGAAVQAEAERAMQAGSLKMIHVESPANPTGSITDLTMIAEIADSIRLRQGHRPIISVDNTFLGPFLQSPLEHGADLCITSLTKYCGGHSDLLAGGVSGSALLIERVRKMRTVLGSHPDPHVCAMLLRSFETLHLRTERACSNARKIARFLEGHPKVRSVAFLGNSGPDGRVGEILGRQCAGAGSTFSFRIAGGEAEAFRMLDRLVVIRLAVSLGGTESLICHPATTTHYSVPRNRREDVGVDDSTLRISVGIEHADDLIADLAHALDAV